MSHRIVDPSHTCTHLGANVHELATELVVLFVELLVVPTQRDDRALELLDHLLLALATLAGRDAVLLEALLALEGALFLGLGDGLLGGGGGDLFGVGHGWDWAVLIVCWGKGVVSCGGARALLLLLRRLTFF